MHYDLIIVGGGLVGAGLAAALRQTGLQIALIEARAPRNNDPRLFALNSGSCQFLQNLGLWPKLIDHATPIHQVHVSQQGHFGAVRLHCKDVQLPTLGHVIPARYIEAALSDMLSESPSITLYCPAKLMSLHQQNKQVNIVLETEEGEKTLQSAIVIGADGAESTVRTQLNIPTNILDYEQSAIVTRLSLQRSHHHVAYERFNAQGAIAMLPLANHECAMIWTANNAVISDLMSLSDELFLQTLQKEFGYRLGRLQKITQRHVFPLRMVRAEKVVEQSVLLLGNSAHSLHPIAAQGFNLALYEVAVLVESIVEKMHRHESLTTIDLQKITERIQSKQAISIGMSHRLAQLFSKDSFFKNIFLQLGMIGLDVAIPIKKQFIKTVIGRTGQVPRLLLRNE